jgi:hypothetical protein
LDHPSYTFYIRHVRIAIEFSIAAEYNLHSNTYRIPPKTNALREGTLSSLHNVLSDQGFEVVKEEEIDVFTFIEAKKINNKR